MGRARVEIEIVKFAIKRIENVEQSIEPLSTRAVQVDKVPVTRSAKKNIILQACRTCLHRVRFCLTVT